jgi:hypothetical protein
MSKSEKYVSETPASVNCLVVSDDDLYDSPIVSIDTRSINFSSVGVINSAESITFTNNDKKILVINETGTMTDLTPIEGNHLTNKSYVDSLIKPSPILNCNGFSNAGSTSIVANVAVFPTSSVLRVDVTSATQQVLIIGSMIVTTSGATANIGMTIGYGISQTQSTSYINLANGLAFSTTEIAVSNASGEQNNLNTLLCSEFIKDASQGQSLNCSVRFIPPSVGTYYFTMRYVSGTSGSTFFRNCNIISLIV